jgi:hypothetical protein
VCVGFNDAATTEIYTADATQLRSMVVAATMLGGSWTHRSGL